MDFSAAVEANEIAFLLAMGRAGGGEDRDDDRITWTIGGSPIAYHNCVVRADLAPDDADGEIVASRELMRAKGVAGSWHVGPSMQPADLASRLERHGFEGGPEPGMARPLDERLPSWDAPPALRIDRVNDASALEDFAAVLAQGFGEGEREARWVQSIYARIGLGDDTAWRHYVARLEGVPVGTASLFVHPAGVGGIYFVCTTPDRRGSGIGGAVTLAAMRGARELGCRLAVLGSSPMGHSLYERLGFATVCEVGVYEWEPD